MSDPLRQMLYMLTFINKCLTNVKCYIKHFQINIHTQKKKLNIEFHYFCGCVPRGHYIIGVNFQCAKMKSTKKKKTICHSSNPQPGDSQIVLYV